MKYIDIHGHLNFVAYEDDRDEVIERAKNAGVAMVTVGTQYDTSKLAVDLANKNNSIFAIVGLHPIHTSKSHHDEQELGEGNKEFTSRGEVVDLDRYVVLAKDKKTIAIGECGLDYYHAEEDLRDKQVKAFESMIDVANEVNKPLMLHLRNGSGRSAYLDAYEILKNRATVKGDLHFFAGSKEEAKPFLDLGYYFSFTGVVTFARSYDEIIKYIPLDRIMSETDCPYVSPIPHRGKRNEPVNVIEVVKMIAKIRGEDEERVTNQLLDNARKFFGIDL
jgi:TatD DNase family protein